MNTEEAYSWCERMRPVITTQKGWMSDELEYQVRCLLKSPRPLNSTVVFSSTKWSRTFVAQLSHPPVHIFPDNDRPHRTQNDKHIKDTGREKGRTINKRKKKHGRTTWKERSLNKHLIIGTPDRYFWQGNHNVLRKKLYRLLEVRDAFRFVRIQASASWPPLRAERPFCASLVTSEILPVPLCDDVFN
jgi:hypothetical protein